MARFVTLYSGSSGNSTLVSDSGTSLLVDMGQSCKKTINALYEIGISASDLDGILVTHEHSDHVSGLMTFLKHYETPLYGSPKTLTYLKNHNLIPENAQTVELEYNAPANIGSIGFQCFGTSHDSVDCVGYRFEMSNGKQVAVATDLGFVSDEVLESLCGCELVGLESNYDENMLRNGEYPSYLKNRIRSVLGHLSNSDCALGAAQLAQKGTKRLVLMHLSSENNEPSMALTSCLGALENIGVDSESIRVTVAPRHRVGEIIEL
ncbi:MAG: MBL fold metallo-hydrolase [Oscillospiraceae bacterium]